MAYKPKGRSTRTGRSSQYNEMNQPYVPTGRRQNEFDRDENFEDVYGESDFDREEYNDFETSGTSRGYRREREQEEQGFGSRHGRPGRSAYGERGFNEGSRLYGRLGSQERQERQRQRPYGAGYQSGDWVSEYGTEKEEGTGYQGRSRGTTGTRRQTEYRSGWGTSPSGETSRTRGYVRNTNRARAEYGSEMPQTNYEGYASEYNEDVYGQDEYGTGGVYTGSSRTGYTGRGQGHTQVPRQRGSRRGSEYGGTGSAWRNRGQRSSGTRERRSVRRSNQKPVL